MFQISFMTDDKKLAGALKALAGLAFNLTVVPVANAVLNGKGGVSQRHPGGGMPERTMSILKERGIKKIDGAALKAIAMETGATKAHASNIMHMLRKKNVLKGNAKDGYTVTL